MSAPVRLAKRIIEMTGCSRSEAERYIEGGWVSVDGRVVDQPQHPVSRERVELDPDARLQAAEPATLLLHTPAALHTDGTRDAVRVPVTPATHWPDDPSGVRLLARHLHRLVPLVPLDHEASGLVVLTQDGRVRRRLTEDLATIEQEFVVEVRGELVPYGLRKLAHGLQHDGRTLPPCKVSWQNEVRLRFAIKDVRSGQLSAMCAQVGLDVVAIRRIRIGRVPLAKMPLGTWRYLPADERF